MTALQYALLQYAKLYVRNLPKSARNEVPELRPLELKLAELLEYDDWYCDAWPGQEHIVTFFSWREPEGLTSTWSVDTKQETVSAL